MIARRAVLRGACACAALAACGRRADVPVPGATVDSGGDTAPGTGDTDTAPTEPCVDTGGSVDGWIELPLTEYPELTTVGGYAYVDVAEALLHLVVAQPTDGCFVAIWRICTHGACELEWDPAGRVGVCPCHGSVFDEAGAIVEGPATEPVRAFPVVRRGDSLFVQR